jgi:8-oxo-dGTP pyrophosphatase MutT (NUDIX family)
VYNVVMSASEISLKNAKENKLFYFVANVMVYRESDGRCLILKRDEREKVHPGKYGTMGGKLEWEDLDIKNFSRVQNEVLDYLDAIEHLLEREAKEEAGIEISGPFHYINSVAFVRPDGIPVVMVKFAGKYKSGEVVPEPGAFTEFKWVNEQEVLQYSCIEGIAEEVKKTIEMFKN